MATTLPKSLSVKVRLFADKLEGLEKFVEGADVDKTSATLRLGDLTRKFQVCEDLIEELSVASEKVIEVQAWSELSTRYYQVASDIARLNARDGRNNASLAGQGGGMGSSTFIEQQRLLKLPVAELPKFSGGHEEWLSYKNSFLSMIDSRTDIDNLVKFMYLRNTLQGDALSKVAIYDISAGNYSKAWKTLTESYERKRILVSKHLDAILDIVPLESPTSRDISKMVDEVKQHLNTLQSLGVEEPSRMVVRLLERALPPSIRQKWEDSLTLDELPTLDQFYKFIDGVVSRLYTMETDVPRGSEAAREGSVVKPNVEPRKARKVQDGTRVFVTSAEQISCPQCSQAHSLYRCPGFNNLSSQRRWDFVRAHRLCFNCLRSHPGKCVLGHCKRCDRYHNTLLHSDSKGTNSQKSDQDIKNPQSTT